MIPIANAFDLTVLRCLSELGGSRVSAVAGELDRSRLYARARLVAIAEGGYVQERDRQPRFFTDELTPEGAAVARRVGSETA